MPLTDDIDADFSLFSDVLEARQALYFQANGRFFQGLPSCTNIPADGTQAVQDRLADRPHYQAEDWLTFLPAMPSLLRMQVEIHQYRTHENRHGFAVFLRVRIAGEIWERVKGYGPLASDFEQRWRRRL